MPGRWYLLPMAEPACHYCTMAASRECPTCGRLYCGDHGEDVCLRCLSPEAATPSVLAYRGALLALAVGAILAIFLAIDPPESKSTQDTVRTSNGSTATATPRAAGTTAPSRTATAAPTQPPAAASPVPTNRVAAGAPYIVEEGDSLSGIAARFGITVEQLIAANPGMTINSNIQPGQQLNIPPAQ